ncbi:hypothetical protein TRVA0_001S00892 [Trichomonascus vanleenenianus]|uniref:uncharacterized protein n=1 Tax=Trichomonascus vanleenenianus TaxID=2268995 RepID=UPI003ECA8068
MSARRGVERINSTLKAIKSSFPDKNDLHARISVALSDSAAARTAIVPFHSTRTDIKTVLDSLLADPLAGDQRWYEAFQNRLLAKDVLVRYSNSFDHVKTHNSLIEFPVPFRDYPHGRETEVIEVNSYKDSKPHADSASQHVFVSRDVHAALTNKVPSHFPSTLVIDVDEGVSVPEGQNVVVVRSKLAQESIDLLIASPRNITRAQELRRKSNIEALEKIVFRDPKELDVALLASIIGTCDSIVEPQCNVEFNRALKTEEEEVKRQRQGWAKNAHEELQTTLTNGLNLWKKRMPWWKLYVQVDDVYDSIDKTLQVSYLPRAKSSLDYLTGRIDAFAEKHNLPDVGKQAPETAESRAKADPITASRNEVMSDNAVDVHNSAIKALTTILFGVQLPCTLLPLLGVYFFDYSLYSMGSVIGLGAVLGFGRLQKQWSRIQDSFKADVLEKARLALNQSEKLVFQRWEKKILDQQRIIEGRKQYVDQLRQDVDELYKTH